VLKLSAFLLIMLLVADCVSSAQDKRLSGWQVAAPNSVVLSGDWDLGYSDDRSLTRVESSQKHVKEEADNKNSTIKDNQKSRLIRFIIYWIALGVFLDIAIYYARFARTNPNHDEFHAAIMMLSFLTALGMDIWFIVTSYKELFSGNLQADIYFYLICASNILALPQLVFGNLTRFKMRDPAEGQSYLRMRKTHKFLGILIYLTVKGKFFFLHSLEDKDKILFPDLEFSLCYIFAIYGGVLIAGWIVLNVLFINKATMFRNKVIKDNTGHFNSAEKVNHMKLLDLRSDNMLDQDTLEVNKDLIWASYEDRVFDLTNLDHPGGRFIIARIKGRELSRHMTAGLEFTNANSSSYVQHYHSPFALNLLEEMFIGFLKIPQILVRFELIEDSDMTFMSLNKLVQRKEDRKNKMINNKHFFDFSVASMESISSSYEVAHLKSGKVEICLTENPFNYFGKYFNVRVSGWDGLYPFDVVLSKSETFAKVKKNVLAYFFQAFPELKSPIFADVGAPVPGEVLYKSAPKVLRKSSTHENMESIGGSVAISTPLEIRTSSIGLVSKGGSNAYSRKLRNTPSNTTIFDLKGPFGPGLGISRFSFGGYLIFGEDTGCLSLIDFLDYLSRYYIYMYSKTKLQKTEEELEILNPFKDDFELTFNNNPVFYFYLVLTDKSEYEAFVQRDAYILATLEKELKLGVFGGISIRLARPELNVGDNLAGVNFTKTKTLQNNEIETALTELGIKKGELNQKVEKAIVVGSKNFILELKHSLSSEGLAQEKFKSL